MSWTSPPVIREDEDEYALKLEFARRWAKNPRGLMQIGYSMFEGEDNVGRAMQAYNWRHDKFVIAEYERLTSGPQEDEEEEDGKSIIIRKLETFQAETTDPKLKLEAIKIEAEVRGVTGKAASVNVNVDNSTTKTVLFVPQAQSIEDFKSRFREQQTNLISNARTVKSASH